MTSALIIQARYGSSRLAGKILAPLIAMHPKYQRPLCAADYMALSAMQIEAIDRICFAIADDAGSDVIEEYIRQHYPTIICTRFSETDVLARYYHSAQKLQADIVMRITSDCPIFDPSLAGQMLALFQQASSSLDYLSNNALASFPHGLDVEIISFSALQTAFQQADMPAQREHVTPYIREILNCRKAHLFFADADDTVIQHRWTLDYAEDLEFFSQLMPLLAQYDLDGKMDFQAIIALLARQPQIVALNHARHICRELLAPAPNIKSQIEGWQHIIY